MAEQQISREQLQSLLEAYPKEHRYALAAMQDMQRAFNYIPREGFEALSEYLDRPVAGLFSMATFYKALSLEPNGKHTIKVCDGTACHIRGAVNLTGSIYRVLGIYPGETTADGEFSLMTVNCLGSCALAPVMVIDEKLYCKVTMDTLPGILEAVREEVTP